MALEDLDALSLFGRCHVGKVVIRDTESRARRVNTCMRWEHDHLFFFLVVLIIVIIVQTAVLPISWNWLALLLIIVLAIVVINGGANLHQGLFFKSQEMTTTAVTFTGGGHMWLGHCRGSQATMATDVRCRCIGGSSKGKKGKGLKRRTMDASPLTLAYDAYVEAMNEMPASQILYETAEALEGLSQCVEKGAFQETAPWAWDTNNKQQPPLQHPLNYTSLFRSSRQYPYYMKFAWLRSSQDLMAKLPPPVPGTISGVAAVAGPGAGGIVDDHQHHQSPSAMTMTTTTTTDFRRLAKQTFISTAEKYLQLLHSQAQQRSTTNVLTPPTAATTTMDSAVLATPLDSIAVAS